MNLEGLDPHWMWLIAAAILGIAELVVPGVFLIWLSAAAAITGLLTLVFPVSLAFQFALFALLCIASVYFGRRWYANNPVESDDPLLNQRASRLIGQTVVVISPIENGSGKVRIGDGEWNCRGPDCELGSRVRITGSDGTCLLVEKAVISHSPAIG